MRLFKISFILDPKIYILHNTESLDGVQTSLLLLDDGGHGDGLTNDGIYGGTTDSLPPPFNAISVHAETLDFTRIAVGSVAIAVNNQPPVAAPDDATTVEGVPVVIDVLANDEDDQGRSDHSSRIWRLRSPETLDQTPLKLLILPTVRYLSPNREG